MKEEKNMAEITLFESESELTDYVYKHAYLGCTNPSETEKWFSSHAGRLAVNGIRNNEPYTASELAELI